MSITKGLAIREIAQDLFLDWDSIRKTGDTIKAIAYGITAPDRYKTICEKQKAAAELAEAGL